MKRYLRVGLPLVAALAILVPLAWLWQASRLPDPASIMQMGTADYGTGAPLGHDHAGHGGTSLTTLVPDPGRTADVSYDLRAEAATLHFGDREVSGFTINGQSPGPTVHATQGQLVEVRFTNVSVPDGATLHWHGIDVPNAMDGVAGVTQDAVPPGGSFTYRFVAEQAGTYWYHSHQVSHAQVIGGLLGAVVVDPADPGPSPADSELLAVAHTYAGIRTINGQPADLASVASPGERVRVRIVNTDNAVLDLWGNTGYMVLAVDGYDVNEPTEVLDQRYQVAAGGRVDLEVVVPASGVARVQLSGATAVILGPEGTVTERPAQPSGVLDLLGYGSPSEVGFDPTALDRHFDYVVTQQPGFVKGMPGVWWAINGNLYPNVPMFMVREGELVGFRLANNSSEVHPMHLHGHHVLVLSRNGTPATGSPWWTDSLNVAPGESYEVVFRADNPGLWLDHCHQLEHARDGMIAHLGYEGITTPYLLGGEARNEPE